MDWLSCSHCKKNIDENERYFTINIYQEKFEFGAVTVIEADNIEVYCVKCAELFDFEKISIPLKKSH